MIQTKVRAVESSALSSSSKNTADAEEREYQIPSQNDFSPPLNLEDTEVISRSCQ